jgi:NTE family protein
MSRIARLLLSSLLLYCLAAAQTQPGPEVKKRPKIGVALSGGSALGLSHVGVLKWFEQNHIPIDYIAGTSMGSLVGGLYASGQPADEMSKFVSNINWQLVLAPGTPFRDLSFRRKQDERQYPTAFEIGLKHGIKLPTGFNAGEGVDLVISRFAAPYSNLESFNDLPTPFRCVATNLNTSQEVVFDKGPLFDALRSSMSLPGVFAPVQLGNMLLVDGGLLNNIPVEVVKRMGADVVIAVALETPPDNEKYLSLLGVAGKSISVMIAENERRSLGKADIIIMPDLKGLGSGEYEKWQEFGERGYQAAASKAKILEKFSVSTEEYAAYVKERQSKRLPDTIKPQFVVVEGDVAPRKKEAIIQTLSAHPNEDINQQVLETEMWKITGLGRFSTATYTFAKKDGKDGLRVLVQEKENGPPFLRIALLLDASPYTGFQFGIGGRITFMDFGGPASEWRTDLSIGVYNVARTSYYYRIKGGKWFISPSFGYESMSLPTYIGNSEYSKFTSKSVGGTADLGYAFGRFGEFRAGYGLWHLDTAINEGNGQLQGIGGRASDVHIRYDMERQNDALVPTSGIAGRLLASWGLSHPGLDRKYPLVSGQISYAHTFNPKYSMIATSEGGWTLSEPALNTRFMLGGAGHMDAYGRAQLLGDKSYYGGFRLLRGISGEGPSMFGKFYLFAAGEAGNAWAAGMSELPRYSGSVGLTGSTRLGGVYTGFGYGSQGAWSIFFRLGQVF